MLCNSWPRTTGRVALCAALCGLGPACKRKPSVDAPAPSAVASAAPSVAEPRCKEPRPGALFTLGDRAAARDAGEAADDDDGTDEPGLPFAVELGNAVARDDGFAVSALSSRAGATVAVVAVLDADAGTGRVAELGKVHGDPDPPELASRDSDLVALVRDGDAHGPRLRLAVIRPGPERVDVVWGAEIEEGRDESLVARIELGAERGLVAWDDYDKTAKHGVVRTASFARKDPSNVTRPRVLSGASDDAEAPRLVRRPGGFWAAWISRPVAEKVEPAAAPKPSAPKPAASADPGGLPDPRAFEPGRRGLVLVPLDDNGAPTAAPKLVTGGDAHVLVFDLAPEPDGAALVAWRDDDTVLGAEARTVHLARVALDGSIEKSLVEDEKVGAGVPSLLVDPKPTDPSLPARWLSLDSVSDSTRLAALAPSATLLDQLGPEAVVRSAEPLVLSRGRMLVGRPRGLAVELSVVECRAGAPPVADAAVP